jgi:hypothetical protein
MDRLQRIEQHFRRPLDKFEQLAAESSFAMVILANRGGTDFEVVDITPMPMNVVEDYTRRGLCFVGVIGLSRAFVPRAELAVPLGSDAITAIVRAFARLTGCAIAHVEKDASVQWLRELWAKPDSRQAEQQALIDEYDDSNDNDC